MHVGLNGIAGGGSEYPASELEGFAGFTQLGQSLALCLACSGQQLRDAFSLRRIEDLGVTQRRVCVAPNPPIHEAEGISG